MFEWMLAFARIVSRGAFAFRALFSHCPSSRAMVFRLANPHAQGESIRRSVRPPVAKDYVIKNGKFVKSNAAASLKSRKSNSSPAIPRPSALSVAGPARLSTPATQPQSGRPTVPTVCELLGAIPAPEQIGANAMQEQDDEPARATACATATNKYIEQVKSDIRSGILDLSGNPWIRPCDAQVAAARCLASRKTATRTTMDPLELRDLVFRPVIFIWAPHLLSLRPFDPCDDYTCLHLNLQWSTVSNLTPEDGFRSVCCALLLVLTVWDARWFPGTSLRCPLCKQAATGAVGWAKPAILRMIDQDAVCLTTRHSCLRCTTEMTRSASKQKRSFRFLASTTNVVEMLPDYVKAVWTLQRDRAGRFCDELVVNLIRALATRSTWAKISAVLNELRATHAANLNAKYIALCATLGLLPSLHADRDCVTGKLNRKWVADMYENDFVARGRDIASELLAEKPADILAVDWTRDAGVRCQGKWMFNVTGADGKVLRSVVTTTTAPLEVEPVLRDLHSCGARPKIIYVDCECCGAWKTIIEQLWPDAHIVLDSFHAIRRLTQTTSSTKHPWHARFCKRLSEAVFAEDEVLSSRFQKALKRSKLSRKASTRLKAECVTRRVRDKNDIERSIEDTIAEFKSIMHETFGPLLTPNTLSAWSSLKLHVRNGCLCDPPGVDLYTAQAKSIVVGGETFDKFKSRRGSSALEGFHGIQKSWLGQQVHSRKRGLALVADGTVRHNRKRRNEMAFNHKQTPPVFAAGLLSMTDRGHQSFIENGIHRLLSESVAHAQSPVRDTDGGEFYDLQSLVHTDGLCQKPTAEAQYENDKALAARTAGYEQSDAMTAELVDTGNSTQLTVPPAQANVASKNAITETTVPPAQAKRPAKQRNMFLDNAEMQHQDQPRALSEQQPLPATSAYSGCRICRMTGTQCRLHKRIQWCSSNDPPFDEWLTTIFPAKKAAAHKRSQRDAAARGKPKGRPRKSKDV